MSLNFSKQEKNRKKRQKLACMKSRCMYQIQGGVESQDVLSLYVTLRSLRKRALQLVALWRKMTCDLKCPMSLRHVSTTGWRRLTDCLKLHIIFRKRATNYRVLLRKMSCKDKASYDSTPPCKLVSHTFRNRGCSQQKSWILHNITRWARRLMYLVKFCRTYFHFFKL